MLHIGTHKTGSSAIQATLVQTDADPGLIYPQAGRVVSGGHLNLAWEALGDNRFRPGRGTTADAIDEITRSTAPMAVLSAETFSARPGSDAVVSWAAKLAEAVSASDLLVVAYVRPQWEFIESRYTQMVKSGHVHQQFEDFVGPEMTRPIYDYHRTFSKWREAFGDSLVVRPYVREVVADFFELIGIEAPTIEVRANIRPGAIELEMLRMLVRDLPATGHREAAIFRWAREHLVEVYGGTPPFRALTPELASHIAASFHSSNTALAETHWNGQLPKSFTPGDQLSRSMWRLESDDEVSRAIYEALLEGARAMKLRLAQESPET